MTFEQQFATTMIPAALASTASTIQTMVRGGTAGAPMLTDRSSFGSFLKDDDNTNDEYFNDDEDMNDVPYVTASTTTTTTTAIMKKFQPSYLAKMILGALASKAFTIQNLLRNGDSRSSKNLISGYLPMLTGSPHHSKGGGGDDYNYNYDEMMSDVPNIVDSTTDSSDYESDDESSSYWGEGGQHHYDDHRHKKRHFGGMVGEIFHLSNKRRRVY